jgi:hypothetical protein
MKSRRWDTFATTEDGVSTQLNTFIAHRLTVKAWDNAAFVSTLGIDVGEALRVGANGPLLSSSAHLPWAWWINACTGGIALQSRNETAQVPGWTINFLMSRRLAATMWMLFHRTWST